MKEKAPAKINLALHVVRRLDNDYHQIDSLVAFLDQGDGLEAERLEEGEITLATEGAFARSIGAAEDNLVLRAAQLLRVKSGVPYGARLRLTKNTPVGAGLGGGSADAAAALRLLNRLWELDYSQDALAELGWEIGSDVPACIYGVPLRMQGVGEQVLPLSEFPAADCVVVYPGQPIWTADVYRNLQKSDFSGELPAFPAIEGDISLWLYWLKETRNDLQRSAMEQSEAVKNALMLLEKQPGQLFVRMTGSGSACFGLFRSTEEALAAKETIARQRPDYWVASAQLAGSGIPAL